MKNQIREYLKLKYQVRLIPLSEEDGGGWLAEIPDLKGCCSDGETAEEALKNIEEAKEIWFTTAIKRGQKIPLPTLDQEEQYSGKFTLRLPKFLHKNLAEAAREEEVSLNSYILSMLSLNFGKAQSTRSNSLTVYVFNQLDEFPKKRYENELFSLNSRLWEEANLINPTGGKNCG
ncbi:MAG: type II toxin-antitoxin system HicB family antitoxin [Firmicutes bacterium]|nr:type II toxin-antitoxin system HicB family antitoxin [Bacillota bacterium]